MPERMMELMAAFGRRNKTSPAAKRAGFGTPPANSPAANGAATGHARRLKVHRLRPTKARTAVLTALERAAPNCLDTHELFGVLNQPSERLAPGTLGRALNDLWAAGLLTRHWCEHGRARYGIKQDEHSARKDTLGCPCGQRRVFIEDRGLRERLRSLAGEAGFDIGKEPVFTISMACAGCRIAHPNSR
ncbi:transcriptional repressor [Pseudomonas silvicola]|nr:transcriptional repressor [Pseudomonas silvicola]